ncbi:hypothetical protein DL766_000850 [Monosporascus sp. MC13-8B]|uniref:Altered inheritance of mitochondria protein 41 n=1 Tax=Monosporascus cannonballus TaxID=155416 RepID=A0ABY0H0U0_9PEZI|nr:hypothetical protein DL762_007032 [Monosporascus cannonballus]RYO94114.1 hypothetical protein DL763_004182 [Monosporascus cannonballus]RYP38640.1 hypothetical protein DL766_000850 [Monosporascus sp. MC13-8B]
MAFRPSARQATSRLTRARIGAPPPPPAPLARPITHHQQSPSPRRYSTAGVGDPPPPPPLLQKLKADLKTAMRVRDAARLTVLRTVLSAAQNASKTSSPIATDAQLVALLRRTRAATEEAAGEARAAQRPDLVEREEAQVRVLDEYVAGSGVEEVGGEQLRAIVAGAVEGGGEGGKARIGDVMKKLLAPGGPLAGKSFEKAELARIVKEVVG